MRRTQTISGNYSRLLCSVLLQLSYYFLLDTLSPLDTNSRAINSCVDNIQNHIVCIVFCLASLVLSIISEIPLVLLQVKVSSHCCIISHGTKTYHGLFIHFNIDDQLGYSLYCIVFHCMDTSIQTIPDDYMFKFLLFSIK